MTEHRLYPPHENVLLNPSLQSFPRSRVKKPLYGVKYFDCPLRGAEADQVTGQPGSDWIVGDSHEHVGHPIGLARLVAQSGWHLRKQPPDCENQASGACADDRAVHPDILEVAPDHELETIRKGARVPAAHGLGDERADLAAPDDKGWGQVFHGFFDVPLHDFVGRERLSDDRDWFLEREAQAR